jgi:hypothetical protein
MTPNLLQQDVDLTPLGDGHMVLKKDRVGMGDSHYFNVQHQDS